MPLAGILPISHRNRLPPGSDMTDVFLEYRRYGRHVHSKRTTEIIRCTYHARIESTVRRHPVPECTGMFIPCTSRPCSVRGVLTRSAARKQEDVPDSLLRNRRGHRFRQWNRAGYTATACRCCLGNTGSAVAITELIAQLPKQLQSTKVFSFFFFPMYKANFES